MEFFKSLIFAAAMVAFVSAQLDITQIQQIGNVQNITGETPLPTDQLPIDQLPTDQLPVDQLPTDQLPTDQLGAVTNATSGVTGENPLPIDQVPIGQAPSTEVPATEAPNRFLNSINRVTNGLSGSNRRRYH